MARRKQQALDVPASAEEAIALIDEYVGAERDAMALRVYADIVIGQTKTKRDADLARIDEAQKTRFASLKAWWEAGGRELAKDKRSHELAGAKIGVRLTPPAVKLAKGIKLKGVVAWLKSLSGLQYLRVKHEIDKPAVIKAIQSNPVTAVNFEEHGVTVVQTDEFFIDAGLDEDAVRKEVAALQPA